MIGKVIIGFIEVISNADKPHSLLKEFSCQKSKKIVIKVLKTTIFEPIISSPHSPLLIFLRIHSLLTLVKKKIIVAHQKIHDGTRIESPKSLEHTLRLLRGRLKQHSRKKLGSANRKRSALRLARLHRRIRNKRKDFLHILSTQLAKTKSVIVLEDLNVRGCSPSRLLIRS